MTAYLEALAPTQRLPDYVPPLPGSQSVVASAAAIASPPTDATTGKRTGRIVSPVRVVHRPGGAAVSFTLEETDAAGQTTLHRVYATKQFAERLAKQPLQQGMLVEVAGQRQLRMELQPGGARRQVLYLYCFGVRVLATPAA